MGNNKTSMQTGMPHGTWKAGDKHPTIEGRIFRSYRKRRGGIEERWITQEMREAYALSGAISQAARFIPNPRPDYQTGSEQGTYKMWEEHPSCDGMFFKQYTTNRSGNLREYWVNAEKMKECKVYTSIYNARRERHAAMRKMSKGEARQVNAFYKVRNIKNEAHGKVVYHVDHIIPVAKGGSHLPSNLQLATATWNLKKGTKISGGSK